MRLVVRAWKDDPVGTLPDDDGILARYARIDAAKWQEMKPIVMRPFTLGQDDRWHHPQLRAFYEKSRRKSKTLSENAKTRWGESGANGIQKQSKSNANAFQKQSMSEVRSTPNGGGHPPSLWDYGVSVLATTGENEKGIRSLVNQKIKEFGEDTVRDALAVTAQKRPAKPKDYFLGVLKNGRKKGAPPKMTV